jgi:hypothetical protein
MSTEQDRPHRAWVKQRMDRMVDELNDQLAHVLPEGMRFAWEGTDEP